MSHLPGATAAVLIGCSLLSSGCQWVPKGRLIACESQNRILLEQSKAQIAEMEQVRAHSGRLANRVIELEDSLAERKDPASLKR